MKEKQTATLDMSRMVGYPLWLKVHGIYHDQPLFWKTIDENGEQELSVFFQKPQLPLRLFLPQALYDEIPASFLRFIKQVRYMQFELLQALSVSEAAKELAFSNPVLFFLLVHKAQENGVDESEFRQLVLQNRRHILDYCGLSATKSMSRLLLKTTLNIDYYFSYTDFVNVLNSERFQQVLRHFPSLNCNHFFFLHNYDGPVWNGLLAILEQRPHLQDFYIVRRLINDCELMGVNQHRLCQIETLAQLEHLHDETVNVRNYNLAHNRGQGKIELVRQYQKKYGNYPSAPLAGNANIEPICSWQDLVEEGLTMQHCVSAYGEKVAQKTVFIYKVTRPERLTLSLLCENGVWRIDEIRGESNAQPSESAEKSIRLWFGH